jgi:hypothetical protein
MSPFGARIMFRGSVKPSANTSNLNPGGTTSRALAGRSITRGGLPALWV